MENDTGAGSGRLSNHVSASPQKPVTPHNDASKMNGTEKPVSNTDNLKLKNLPIADVLVKVPEVVAELGKLEDYGRGEGMRYQKMLGDLYWDHQHHRPDIGDVMAKNGYAGISIKMLKVLNTIGIFKNDDVWFPTYYTYNTLWNFSDASEQLARDLAEADAVRLLTLNCGHKPYLNAIRSKNVHYVIKASLSILHNISRIPDVKHFFKEHKTPEVIMPFITSDDDMFKALAMLTLAYIVEEEENAKLIDETGTIKNVVSWIGKAQNSTKHRYKGFSTWELAQGLDKLAVNDTNKAKIVDAGALPVFLRMLQHDDVKEQSTAARCIWTLSFDHDVRQQLAEHEGLVPELTRLQESTHTEVRKNAKGALWVIKGENDPNTTERPRTAHKKHIFISYCWSDQKTVKQLRERLREEGYAVWIDYEQMGGSTLESMAAAIENSAVVLLGMSEKYKQSPNCRTEAEYTFTLRKEYIPVMLQQKYRPDGWLGIILGAKLFFDFSGKYPFEKSMQGLLKELRGRGQQQANNQSAGDSVDAPIQSSELVPVHAGVKGGNPGHNPVSGTELVPHGGAHTSAVMSCDQVSQWLSAHNLHNYVRAFDQIDGELLWQLKLMRQDAPEFFYGCLQQKLAMNLVDILRFTAALDQLR